MKACRYLALILTVLLLACQTANREQSGEPTPQRGVAIYLIENPIDLYKDATALDNATVSLAEEPFINYDQIVSYSQNSYTLSLKEESVEHLQEISKNLPLQGIPFALVVDGNVVYYGLFWNPISSFTASYPYIVLSSGNLTIAQTSKMIELQIEFRTRTSYPPGAIIRTDLRNDPRLLDRLRKDNKLK